MSRDVFLEPSAADRTSNTRHCFLAFIFRAYKVTLSPLLHAVAPSRCLYLPTCSEYAFIAIHRFGILRGLRLALKRFARCQPWGRGGLDPVPQHPASACTQSASGSNPADHLS